MNVGTTQRLGALVAAASLLVACAGEDEPSTRLQRTATSVPPAASAPINGDAGSVPGLAPASGSSPGALGGGDSGPSLSCTSDAECAPGWTCNIKTSGELATGTCESVSFTVGGTVSGLSTGDSIVLQDNMGDNLTVSANGAFTLATPLTTGQTYDVTVLTQPRAPAETCAIMAATGTVGTTNVTSVQVTCSAPQCITFEACVNGEDQVTIANGTLTITHLQFSMSDQLGMHPSCVGVVSTVNPSVSMYDPVNGRFAVNGVPYPVLPLFTLANPGVANLASFVTVMGRGTVTMSSANTVDLNDFFEGGAALYVVSLCD
jgi:hypothetical protein